MEPQQTIAEPEVVVTFTQGPTMTILGCGGCQWKHAMPAGTAYALLMARSREHLLAAHFRVERPFWQMQAESMFFSTIPNKYIDQLRTAGQLSKAVRDCMNEALG